MLSYNPFIIRIIAKMNFFFVTNDKYRKIWLFAFSVLLLLCVQAACTTVSTSTIFFVISIFWKRVKFVQFVASNDHISNKSSDARLYINKIKIAISSHIRIESSRRASLFLLLYKTYSTILYKLLDNIICIEN